MADLEGQKERLKKFIDYTGLPVYKFELKCGLAKGYVSAMRRGLGRKSLDKISEHYSELNTVWLITGEGEMLKPASGSGTSQPSTPPVSKYNIHDNHNVNVETMQTEIEFLRHQIEVKDELIKQLQAEKAEYWEMIKNFTK